MPLDLRLFASTTGLASARRVERLRVLGRRPIAVETVASVPGIEVVFQFGPRAGVTVRAASDRP